MVSLYIVLCLLTLFSSISDTLGSEETRILDNILADISLMRSDMDQMSSMMDTRLDKLSRQVEDLRDIHLQTKAISPTTPSPLGLPAECFNYKILNDSWRHIDYINRGRPCSVSNNKLHCGPGQFNQYCDTSGENFRKGWRIHTYLDFVPWYRFTGAAGTKLPTSPPPEGRGPICETSAPAYISSGGNPTILDGIVTRDVCFGVDDRYCQDRTHKTTVKVAACRDAGGDYFVYQLEEVPICNLAYCAID